MSKLTVLLEAVKEKNLNKTQLEEMRDDMTHLFSSIMLELAELEKSEALYFLKEKTPDNSDVSIKRMWRATLEGQRLIELSRYQKALEKEISSLKSRIYANMY